MKSVNYKEAKEVIKTLKAANFYCECPCGCGEEIRLRDADLFYLDDFTPKAKSAHKELVEGLKERRMALKERERNMRSRPQITTRAVNIGFILERIVPAFDHFPFEHNDCRSLFDPIDYLIFEGLNKRGVVSKLIFTEIKSGSARLNNNQKEIKELVKNKKVEFKTY